MTIIKLGGSVIQESLDQINPLLIDFVRKIENEFEKAVITVGGGLISRLFQKYAAEHKATIRDQHQIGIRSLLLQAELVKSIFDQKRTYPILIDNKKRLMYAIKAVKKYDFFITGAWNLGKSSDYETIKNAIYFNTKEVLRITNVDYVYDSDPRTNPNANRIFELTWEEYLNIIGNPKDHEPGKSYPVDPFAAKLAQKHKITMKLTSLRSFLENNISELKGSTIK